MLHNTPKIFFKRLLILLLPLILSNCEQSVKKTDHGVEYEIKDRETNSIRKVSISVLSPTVIKVAIATSDSAIHLPSMIAHEKLKDTVHFDVSSDDEVIVLSTDSLSAFLNKRTGTIAFQDRNENLLLETKDSEILPFEIKGTTHHKIKQHFSWDENEALYGLGQHQLRTLNLRRQSVELSQHNTRVSIPVLLSTKGYGLYWDNYSQSYFHDAGDSSYLASDVADKIQYYFVKGKKFDDVISGLRTLTGASPMLPRWAFGYVQSRNRYKTKDELMGVVKKHRELNIPIDAIILDYLHWGEKGFGSMMFDSIAFPNPEEMIKELHDQYHCKLIVSVWPSFNKKSANWQLFKEKNFLLDLDLGKFGEVHDAFNPQAGALYWKLVKDSYWDKGVDGIWFDATEPEKMEKFKKTDCFLGPTAKYQNLFSYFDMKNVFESQSKVDTRRVYVLTRSAFLGQQQFGSVVWSGDIKTDFNSLKEQIPSGLNFCMTGLPYWNTDIGGYLGGDPKDEKYQELFVRWFQYGAFTPMFRVHGRRHPFKSRSGENEVWSFGETNQKILEQYIKLRYRLLPYMYSLSHKVHSEGYTLMRALVFDFMDDPATHNITDQFLLGNIMVCPVTDADVTERSVYLPKGCQWFDFWTGEKYKGGQTITASAPIDRIPLFVKEGTLLPLADVMQYAAEKPYDDIELRVYPGKSTEFSLYEDQGENTNYQKGKFSTILFSYDEQENQLTIGKQKGNYNGLLKKRDFRITKVSKGFSIGIEKTNANKSTPYNGNAIKVSL
ncbi:MAG: TIM-barrel domain-containing protein [Bacteroidota bacterium]